MGKGNLSNKLFITITWAEGAQGDLIVHCMVVEPASVCAFTKKSNEFYMGQSKHPV